MPSQSSLFLQNKPPDQGQSLFGGGGGDGGQTNLALFRQPQAQATSSLAFAATPAQSNNNLFGGAPSALPTGHDNGGNLFSGTSMVPGSTSSLFAAQAPAPAGGAQASGVGSGLFGDLRANTPAGNSLFGGGITPFGGASVDTGSGGQKGVVGASFSGGVGGGSLFGGAASSQASANGHTGAGSGGSFMGAGASGGLFGGNPGPSPAPFSNSRRQCSLSSASLVAPAPWGWDKVSPSSSSSSRHCLEACLPNPRRKVCLVRIPRVRGALRGSQV